MRIVQIMPGYVENYYCENCLRDNTLVRGLRLLGHETLVAPLYLPVRFDDPGVNGQEEIFYGGINVYLQQKFSLFRKTPRWLDRILDAPKLLRWAARKGNMTRAREVADLLLSTLRGQAGNQVKELDRLAEFLAGAERPDVICLSNALLVGLAQRLKERLGVPIVCMLQDEDDFLDALPEPQRSRLWEELRKQAQHVDRFIAFSDYYANLMQQRLKVPRERVQRVYHGIFPDEYPVAEAITNSATIGYLSQISDFKGLDLLAEAFIELKRQERFSGLRLRVAGDKMAGDSAFLTGIEQRLSDEGLREDVEIIREFDRDARCEFLESLTVLSVPEKHGESYGLYVLEALATGVPVVQPANGVFPELLEITGGGVLFEPNNRGDLVKALAPLLADGERARRLGAQGRRGVHKHFNIENTAGDLAAVLEGAIEQYREEYDGTERDTSGIDRRRQTL